MLEHLITEAEFVSLVCCKQKATFYIPILFFLLTRFFLSLTHKCSSTLFFYLQLSWIFLCGSLIKCSGQGFNGALFWITLLFLVSESVGPQEVESNNLRTVIQTAVTGFDLNVFFLAEMFCELELHKLNWTEY